MKLKSTFAVALLCLIGTFPALAKSDYSKEEIREIADRYGDCVVKNRESVVRDYILGIISESKAVRAKRQESIIVSSCVNRAMDVGGAQMRFPSDFYRYSMAQALFKVDKPKLSLADLTGVAPLDHRKVKPWDEAKTPKSKKKAKQKRKSYDQRLRASIVSAYGECVVRAAPDAARQLLVSETASDEENAAFQALSPHLGGCVPQAVKVSFTRVELKGTIAVNYYRLSHAAGVLQHSDSGKEAAAIVKDTRHA